MLLFWDLDSIIVVIIITTTTTTIIIIIRFRPYYSIPTSAPHFMD